MNQPDLMFINDLRVECIIGTYPHERVTPQPLWINITLVCELARAGKSDSINDTVDYQTLSDDIIALTEASQFLLIERLVDEIASLCLKRSGVTSVTVRIDKPQALDRARSAAVQITRVPS